MKSLDRRLNELEKCVLASKLQVNVIRTGETMAQVQSRMGFPGFVVFVPEKDAPDQEDGDES